MRSTLSKCVLASVSILMWMGGCGDSAPQKDLAVLTFRVSLDETVYSKTRFKKPPQFAVWIEDETGGTVRTVFVTEKTGAGSWGNGTKRPVSLPVWTSRWNREAGTSGEPTVESPAAKAVTGATPGDVMSVGVIVDGGRQWDYFVEVNVSGDFNESFVAESQDGSRDTNGNGQPSIVYKGTILSKAGQTSRPQLIGRTEQYKGSSEINPDLDPITTAAGLLKEIEVRCDGLDVE